MPNNIICKDDIEFAKLVHRSYTQQDRQSANKVFAVLSAFMQKPKKIVKANLQALSKIQAQGFGVSTDFDRLRTNAFNVNIQEDNFDLGYEKVFRTVPKDRDKDFWEIYEVTKGLQFRRVQEGQRIRVEGFEGEVTYAYVDYYGGALGWTDRMIRYRKVAAMVDKAMMFRNAFWLNKANNHYVLLAVAAALNAVTAWQGVAADGQLRRDIQTLNVASFTLANRCRNKGFGDTANAQLVLYANPLDRARILAAMRATTNQTLGAGNTTVGQQVNWNITPIFTFNTNITAGSPLLILPYNKIQRADDMQPTTYVAPKDILTLNEMQSVWAIYGAAIGDTDQCQQLTLG